MTLSRSITVLFLISQSAAGAWKKKTELPVIFDLIHLFSRFQLNVQRTACCFELHVLGWFGIDFYHKCQESGE